MKLNQKGVTPVLILIAVIGVVVFLAVASSAPFKNGLLSSLFPKEESQAAAGDMTGATFVDTFTGFPATPTPFTSPNWDIAIHTRTPGNLESYHPMQAHHGADCSKPINDTNPGNPTLVTHPLNGNYADYVFQCRDHVMTAADGPDYSVTYLTPNHLADFRNGEAVVKFDMDTLRTSGRDWVDLWVTPYAENLQMPIQNDLPDLQGVPRNAVQIRMGFGMSGNFGATVWRNFAESQSLGNGQDYNSILTSSAARRDTFELRISKTHLKFCLTSINYSAGNVGPQGQTTPQPANMCWIDNNISTLPFDQGVVQFGHHSYNPSKDCEPTSPCIPNTWHWDSVSISPAVPFTMIKPNKRIVMKDDANKTVTFASAAPANSFLRFSALGRVELSFNNGATWQLAPKQPAANSAVEHFSSYFVPVTQGTQNVQVRFSGDDWYSTGFPMAFRDAMIWSSATPTFPSTQPSPSLAPSPSPSPIATPTPAPSVKPGDIDGNNKVDIFDYNILLTNFGKTGANIPGDFDKNGKVDIFDFNTLLSNFGK